MKTKWTIIPVIILVLGCSREIDDSRSYIDGEFTLYATADENRTRTVLQQDGSIYWSPMDCIKVFYGDLSGKFTSNNTVPADYAEFTGLLGAFTMDGITEFVAVYPYSQETSLSGNTLSVHLPSEQKAVEGTFADNLFISVAKSKNEKLFFKNVCGGVKFSLGRDDIKKVVFRGNNGESLAGRLNIIFDSDGIPQVSGINDGSASVSLVAPDGGTFKKGAWHYLVLAPQSLSKGYTMELYGDELVGTESSESPVTIRRSAWGVLKNLGEIDDSGRFIYYTSPGGQIVSPRDEACFGDATLISNKYENGIGVMEFDKPLTVIEMSAFGFCDFETVTLPEGLTDIEGYAFGYCTSLKSISFPSTLRSLGFHAIRDCYSLTTVEIPGNLDDLSDAAFDNCKSLQAFYGKYASDDHRWLIADGVVKAFAPAGLTACSIPSYATAIGDYVFHSCSKLNTITIPDGILTIGSGSFAGCSAMTTVTIPETVMAIGSGAFSQCFGLQAFYGKYASEDHRCLVVEGATVGFAPVGLTDYTIPSIVTNIAYSTFMHCGQLKTITIPSTVTTIGEYAFLGCSSLDSITILSGTPPRLASIQVPTAIFDDTNECPIYVPSGSVEAYKTASGWSRYAERIQEIKNNPIPVPELVDLGLSVKWASFNLGASKPEEYGNYYAWGETEPKSEYYWSTYKWGTSIYDLTKYCTNSSYGKDGFSDGKYVLEPEDDAAHVALEDNWRMPTLSECEELISRCTWEWTSINGINGRMVTAPNGNSIFLPAAGNQSGSSLSGASSYGHYLSSSILTNYPYDARHLRFYSSDFYLTNTNRYNGYTIRPVYGEYGESATITVTPSSLDFGNVTVGESGKKAITISNTGNKVLIVSKISFPSGYTGDWSSGSIASGSSKVLNLTFRPTAAQSYNGNLTIESDASNGDQIIPLSGTGEGGSSSTAEYVDLGLSVKWATFNVGATSPEEFGNHYAWGETTPKEEYSWDTYTWCNGTRESITKYCYDSRYGYNGFTDRKEILLPEDDAATVNWGKNWRMPTQEESWELAGNTTISLVEYNGVTVFELKSKINGNVVYFPIAGYRDENPGLHDATYYRSYYWCSNIDSYRTYDGYNFCLSNEDYYDPYGISDGCTLGVYTWAHRYKGYTIRPVYDDR